MVSNAELHKLITQFQDDFKSRCEAQEKSHRSLAEKIDNFGARLDRLDTRLNTIDENHLVHSQKFVEVDEKFEEVEAKIDEYNNSVIHRLSQVESQLQRLQVELPEEIRQLRLENNKLKEELENRTNRQLRRTLIFKNIPETKDDESYSEVKELLAQTISSNSEITKEEAFACIERAHREAKRDGGVRQGKRKIFAAFLNWELPQRILDEFRKRCIADRNFNIYVDQMYGPLTSQRRNMAFQVRKTLKDEGTITSGFVDFPARLMVNKVGDVDRNGKKIYRIHTNFSDHEVVKN